MSLLCLELCTPGEVSLLTGWLILVAGVCSVNRARVGALVCSAFARGVDMGGMVLGNLEVIT